MGVVRTYILIKTSIQGQCMRDWLQFNGFLMLELPACALRGAEAELIAVQLEFDMWFVQYCCHLDGRVCVYDRRA
jgi:hypothetical protein